MLTMLGALPVALTGTTDPIDDFLPTHRALTVSHMPCKCMPLLFVLQVNEIKLANSKQSSDV